MFFNEKLKLLRKEKNLTQEELSEKLNVSRQAITKWESGLGTPDVENLKQISLLFNITIDELVKENELVKKEHNYIKELEIDHTKHFDINISKINELNLMINNEEKVKVEVLSNNKVDLNKIFKIKFDDIYNRLDINIKQRKFTDGIINIYLPQKYINDIELKSKIKTLNIFNLEIKKLEIDGELKYLNSKNSKGKIVLNTTKCDVEAKYDEFVGILEVNIVNSKAIVEIPKGTQYKTVLKGIKNEFINKNSNDNSENIIELNGINSKLNIIEY